MTLILLIFASAVLAFGTFRRAATSLGGPIALVMGFMVVQCVLRPMFLALGWDQLFLAPPGATIGYQRLLEQTQLLVLVWLTVFYVVSVVLVPSRAPAVASPPRHGAGGTWLPPDRLMTRSLVILVLVSLAGTLPLILEYGGVFEFAAARKLEQVEVNFLLRTPAVWVALIALPLADRARAGGRYIPSIGYVGVYVLGGALAFSWGARDGFVFPLIAVACLRLSALTHRHLDLRRIGRLALAALVVVTVVYQLRLLRDVETTGALVGALDDKTPVRRISVGTNTTMFDALAVARSHWPTAEPFVGVDDFVESSRVLLFALSRNPPPDWVAVNVRVARVSSSTRLNGTPSTAIGDWYIAYGALGVAAGACLSAVLLCALERWHARARARASLFATAVVTLVVFGAMTGGITSVTLQRAPALLLPALLIVALQVSRQRRAASRTSLNEIAQSDRQPAAPERPRSARAHVAYWPQSGR